jgi:Zn-dependent M28 family amino/carboxypeptidase
MFLAGAVLAGCVRAPAAPESPVAVVDTARILRDLSVLAADSMEGRGTGTEGIERARRYLLGEFEEAGLQAFDGGYERPFSLPRNGRSVEAANLVGYVAGERPGGPVIVVTAHYDHVGMRDGEIFNGADDNASGVAALLALARHLQRNPPEHMVLIAALDAEEVGLLGAEAFVEDPPVERDRIALNVNLDMVGRNARGELYAAGTHHYPALRPLLEEVAATAPIRLLLGHDSPDLPPGQDWTNLSDHGPFHAAEIPFVYFGVEDHPDYHRPTDDVERIDPAFFAGSVATIIQAVEVLDEGLAGHPEGAQATEAFPR